MTDLPPAELSATDAITKRIRNFEVPRWNLRFVIICLVGQIISLIAIIVLVCLPQAMCASKVPFCSPVIIAFFSLLILILLIVQLWRLAARLIHEKRIVDEHKAKNLISDIDLAMKREVEGLDGTSIPYPEDFDELKVHLEAEINRLRGLNRKDWVEFQFVTVQQLWIDFLDPKELKVEARSTLEDLQDFAEDPKISYDTRQYWRWENRISRELEILETKEQNECSENELEKASEGLRANLRTLYFHIADYSFAWSRGAVLIRLLLSAGFGAVVVFAFLGLLPLFFEPTRFTIFNWSMLAAAGAVTGVLKSLHKADSMEVGAEDGNHEVWRAIATVPLGLIAGIAAYALIASGAISGGLLVPSLDIDYFPSSNAELIRHIGTHILWPLGAGFLFEATYSRL